MASPVVCRYTAAMDAGSGAAHRLWYRQPAARWLEALPVGNGRLGAMVLHLLPALPTAWPDGAVTGLRARGGLLDSSQFEAG